MRPKACRQTQQILTLVRALVWLAVSGVAAASEYRGQVTFAGLAVPGATVTATQAEKELTVISDQGGLYTFADLPDGAWKIRIQMQGFSTATADVTIAPYMTAGHWELKLLSLEQMLAQAKLPNAPSSPPPNPASTALQTRPNSSPTSVTGNIAPDIPKPQEDERSSDGFLVNGSSNNAATSKYSIDQAFGNSRSGGKSLYNGGLAAIIDNSALNARPYSLSGLDTPKASYNRFTGILTLGGPIRIPHLLRHGPNFFLAYQWTRDRTEVAEAGLVSTAAERSGDLSGDLNALGQPVSIVDPGTSLPFPRNLVPVSPQARALLQLYPLPNIAGTTRYNYQIPVVGSSHRDALLSRLDKSLGRKDQLYSAFNVQSIRAGNGSLFGFIDRSATLGINTNINWSHRFSQHLFLFGGYRFSRLRTHVTPFFQNREKHLGSGGHHGQQSGACLLGSAHTQLLERPLVAHRCPELLQSQPHRRLLRLRRDLPRPPQHHARRRPP